MCACTITCSQVMSPPYLSDSPAVARYSMKQCSQCQSGQSVSVYLLMGGRVQLMTRFMAIS